jgi:hypothetical protein
MPGRRATVATVKALLRNKLAPGAAFGGDPTEGQLLSPRALTSRHRCPTGTTGPRASGMAGRPGEGLPLPRHPLPARSGGHVSGHRRPGQLLVVGLAVAQAAVQDPDQPIRQGPQGLMVGGATSPVGVVVATSAG